MKLSLASATLVLTCLAATSGWAGCASSPRAEARFGASESAIRNARGAGADRVPEAAVHLELALHQLAQARRYVDDGEREKASSLLARAEADAEVAFALAREAKSRQAADEMAARVRDFANGTHAGGGDPM